MSRTMLALAVLALTVAAPPAAHAGIADSPLPVLQVGATTLHLYSVPSIIAIGSLGTYFGCTSTDTTAMQVGVEVFGSAGGGPFNDAAAESLTVQPGATVIFGTGSVSGFSIDSNLGGALGNGSARILATSKKITCTAFVADRDNNPPTSMVHLDLISKLKQKGD